MGMLHSGKSMTFELIIPDPIDSFSIPIDVNWVILRNIGANDFRFQFDDDGPTDFFTIKAGETLDPIRVQGGTNFNTDGVGGSTTIQGIAWG